MTAFEQYRVYLETLFAPTDTVCFAFIGEANGKKAVSHEFIKAADACTEQNFLALQQTNKNYNIYVAMNPFKPELIGKDTGRTKANVETVKRLYAEVDTNGPAVLERITTSSSVPRPSVVLESSPGKFQFIWNVNGLTKETAEPLLKAIANNFETDPAVAEVARVLRVPGFENLKYETRPAVKVLSISDDGNYDLVDFRLDVKQRDPVDLPRNSDGLVKVGFIQPWMVKVAGKLREDGLTPEEIEPILIRRVHESCDVPPGGFNLSKIKQVAQSMANYPAGQMTDLIMTPTPQTSNTIDVSKWLDQFRSVEEMEDGPIVMVIDGVLQEGTCFIGANPGDGKTLIALAFAKAISTGTPLFGLPQYSVKEARTVIYLIPESRDRAFRKRCEAFRMPTDKMKFMARTISAGVSLELSDPYLLEAVRQTKAVVFLDTASRFMKGMDENAAAQNRQLVNDVISLLAAGAVCVVLIHHATKAAKANQERMSLENMLRGTSDFGAMCDQAYGIRKDMLLYANGSGPMEIDLVSLKDREQIGGLTSLRLAASRKSGDIGIFPSSYINETGNFKVVNDSEAYKRDVDTLVALVKSDPNIPSKELAEKTGLTDYGVKQKLSSLGWHRVQGGPGGASPWHQDVGLDCPYSKQTKKPEAKPKPEPKPPKPGIKEAVAYLQKELAGTSPDGEYVSEVDIFRGADEQGLSDSLIAKAKKRLGVVVGKDMGWSLPSEEEASAIEASLAATVS